MTSLAAEGGNLSDGEPNQLSHHAQQVAAAQAAAQAAAEEEAQRISLLDVIIEEYNQEKGARTARMLLIGELDAEKIPLLQKFHADFLDSLDLKDETTRMTGVLFVLNNSVMIQMVEAPTKVLVQLMRNLAAVSGWASKTNLAQAAATSGASGAGGQSKNDPSAAASESNPSFIHVDPRHQPLLKSSSILSFTEEVPREFHIWAFRSIRLPQDDFASSGSGINLQRDALKLCFETVKNMLELGRELQMMNEEKAIDFIQTSASRQLTMKLPTAERLIAYITNLPDLCTLSEWLDIYDTPIEFTLENEKVWPVEPFLKY